MSLVEVLVSLGILGICLMGFMQMMKSVQRSSRKVASTQDLQNVMQKVAFLLRNEEACTQYFVDKTFDPSPGTLSSQVVPSIAISEPVAGGVIVAGAGIPIAPELSITEVSLKNFMRNGPSVYIADVDVGAAFRKGLEVHRTHPVQVKTVPAGLNLVRIVGCIGTGYSKVGFWTASRKLPLPPLPMPVPFIPFFTTIPGLSITFALERDAMVLVTATGQIRLATHPAPVVSFRFRIMVDDEPSSAIIGDYGAQLDGQNHGTWNYQNTMPLPAGQHTIALQARSQEGSLGYLCAEHNGHFIEYPYTNCHLNITAYYP